VQTFSLPFGAAHVLYPEASEERCTAALVLDVDPVGLVRRGRSAFALAEYVNDRPYVASSLLSVALVRVFKTAMEGLRPELASSAIPLEAALPAVPARGGEELVRRLFEPLGYSVSVRELALDPAFPEWGASRRVSLRLSATVRLSELLTHLYVLLPVLDDEKHYWVDDSEVEKLLRRGAEWLPVHPERELIARRYLKHERRLFNPLLASFEDSSAAPEEEVRSASRCATSGWGRCKRSCRPRARGACSISAAGRERCSSGSWATAMTSSPASTSPRGRCRRPSGG
jgi:3' terminal RNA ribose 2'-O-methyltransferase Hen1